MLEVIVLLVVLGVILALVHLIPIDGRIKTIIDILVIAMVILWLVSMILGTGRIPLLRL